MSKFIFHFVIDVICQLIDCFHGKAMEEIYGSNFLGLACLDGVGLVRRAEDREVPGSSPNQD